MPQVSQTKGQESEQDPCVNSLPMINLTAWNNPSRAGKQPKRSEKREKEKKGDLVLAVSERRSAENGGMMDPPVCLPQPGGSGLWLDVQRDSMYPNRRNREFRCKSSMATRQGSRSRMALVKGACHKFFYYFYLRLDSGLGGSPTRGGRGERASEQRRL